MAEADAKLSAERSRQAKVTLEEDLEDAKNVKVDQDLQSTGKSKKMTGNFVRDFPEEFQGIMLGRRRFASRGVRLPSESILLGKRRLPVEAVLLGRRDLPNEGILLGKRR